MKPKRTYVGKLVVPHLKQGTCWKVTGDATGGVHIDLVLVMGLINCDTPSPAVIDNCICLDRPNRLTDIIVDEQQVWTPITDEQYWCVRNVIGVDAE